MKQALLIGVGSYREELEESLLELENLALANNIETSQTMIQGLSKPSRVSYVKKGKLAEIKEFFENNPTVYLVHGEPEAINLLADILYAVVDPRIKY